ncbi:hypothetical protein HMPREF0083_04200 [Aneurinibacillus aneurinilyticus ATCC 12856]|uniref:Uncharacterized protein n=1 Tax=Aneurinibacillus aneurinilyticus ATCC 12856 TaxID=649747 RepID=U1WGT4_ANEAE|nr:hypothetical protein HMPREF0083_04200 [Aneurinibacillus aneurinilyticus ATCC 12856]
MMDCDFEENPSDKNEMNFLNGNKKTTLNIESRFLLHFYSFTISS